METRYRHYLSLENIIFVEFTTKLGKVTRFNVKLLCVIHGKDYEVVRFDGAHGIPHKDILNTTGRVVRKV